LIPGRCPRYAIAGGHGICGGGMSGTGGQRFSQSTFPLLHTHLVPHGSNSCGICLKFGNLMPAKEHEPSETFE
jgi:hypothetical protein